MTKSDLLEVGRYRRLSAANERGLAILAIGLGYWLFRDNGDYVLCVEPEHSDAVTRELQRYESERRLRRRERRGEATAYSSLFIFGWLMTLFMVLQQNAPRWLVDNGTASSRAIMENGELWRTVTALTLHADLSHLAANLLTGILFCGLALPLFGTGVTWAGVLLSGAAGNLINAWIYRNVAHISVGASTAVFGALGMLIAGQTMLAIVHRKSLRKWEVILPPGAGLALLAYLGTGGERTDLLAHLWGFVCGVGFAIFAIRMRMKRNAPHRSQRLIGLLVVLVIAGAWICAALQHHLQAIRSSA